jgi:hypothetical protein
LTQGAKEPFSDERSPQQGYPVEVTITILPPLARSIAATPTGDLTFHINQFGRPWKKESFGNWFKRACTEAGIKEDGMPIRLLPTPTKCRMGPFSRVEPVEGRRCGPAGHSEQ